MINIEVNLIAVLVSAVMYMSLGIVWYSPSLFGKQWNTLIDRNEGKSNNKILSYGVAAGSSLLTSYVLAHMIQLVDARTIASGIETGFWLWIGFIATTGATNYSFEGRSWQLFFIDQGYHLVGLILMGGVFGVWI
ncbi:DUF1761 domain-containing protein [candidate division WWE3 bacterium]|nr:DUF1761 domain-containing protein [candidate division WWE3 bacterium]